jgi:hypothetical protein
MTDSTVECWIPNCGSLLNGNVQTRAYTGWSYRICGCTFKGSVWIYSSYKSMRGSHLPGNVYDFFLYFKIHTQVLKYSSTTYPFLTWSFGQLHAPAALHPLNRKLGGPHECYEIFSEGLHLFSLSYMQPCRAHSRVVQTRLSRLRKCP